MVTNKKSRLTALLLVLVLMMSLLPSVFAAGDAKPKGTLITDKGAYIAPGDTVAFRVTFSNEGDGDWERIKLTSTLTFIDIVSGSLRVDGAVTNYTFPSSGKLTVDLGTISAGTSKVITFSGTIKSNVTDKISYSFVATGYNTNNVQRFTVVASTFTPLVHTSAPPAFNVVEEGASVVTGTGIAGSKVTVTLPDASVHEVTVAAGGTWSLPVPAGTTLLLGQELEANQTEVGKIVSPDVKTTVVANSSHDGAATKTSRNTTTSGSVAKIGDVIEYTITAVNNSTPSSRWACVVTDTISPYVDFVTGSVQVDGVDYPSTYTASTRILRVDLGNIGGGVTKTLTFQVKINGTAYGQNIENTANVGGVDVVDPDPKPVIEKSADPVIDPVYETDDEVTGDGVPGATVTVTFPDGTKVDAPVDPTGNWTVDVPPGVVLRPNDDIKAIQNEPDKDPSNEVSTKVLPDTNPIKDLAKSSQNLTTTTGSVANIGDIIEYTIVAKNTGTASSTWACVVTDTIPAGVTFTAGSVRINDVAATAAQFNYDAATRLLTVNLGGIVGGTQKVITFRVTINSDAHGQTITNVAFADDGDIVAPDPDPIDVIEKSRPPVIDPVIETDPVVTGTGIPDSTVTVRFPSGSTATATVSPTGTWSVNVPTSVILHEDDVITATQKEPLKDVSDPASTIVLPNPDPVPSLTKTSQNLTTATGLANINDTIEYTIVAKNDGAPSSVWPCVVTDELHAGLTFTAGSVRIDGVAATGTQFSYNAANHMLTVNLGNIAGGGTKTITFRVTINKAGYGQTIVNTAKVGPEEATDPDPPIVVDQTVPPTIDEVLETDDYVTGTGIPGADIEVTFPDGSKEDTVVQPNGTWEVEVPGPVDLKPGDKVTAVQTEDGKDPSEEAEAIVQPDRLISPNGEISWLNYFGGTTAKAGDYLEFYGSAWNEGTASSTWVNAVAEITLDPNITFANVVEVNGSVVPASRYTYNSANNTLSIQLGNIIGGNEVKFKFRSVVNLNVPDTLTELYVGLELPSLYE